jgi:hypothetical protein
MKYNQFDPTFLALTETWSLGIKFNFTPQEECTFYTK